MSSIHGHEVLHMMVGNQYDDTSLLAAINQKFGTDAIFHTCSKFDMNAQQLIDLLKAKGKFTPTAQSGFTVDSSKICNH